MTDAMAEEIVFGPFRLDRRNARFMRDGQSIALTPKAFDVLAYLAGRANQLVTKKELLAEPGLSAAERRRIHLLLLHHRLIPVDKA